MPQSRLEDFKTNNAISQYNLYGQAPAKYPYPWGYEIYNFGRQFLSHLIYILSLSDACQKFLKKYINVTLFTLYPKLISTWGWRSWNLQFFVSFPSRCYILNLVKIGPVVLKKNDKRGTTNNDGRQPIEIGYLCDSGNLKMYTF